VGKFNIESKLYRARILVAFVAILFVAAGISALLMPKLKNTSVGKTLNGGASEEFKIIKEGSKEVACYASILYLDGYEYSPESWLDYSRNGLSQVEYESLKGEKLGVVTLDLKGKSYTGIPPSFSSTHDEGTEVFTIKNMKKERAVLVVNVGYPMIFYRTRKFIPDEKTTINLTMAQVFNMITDMPKVASIELRSEENGAWLESFDDKQLLELINKELPEKHLLQRTELGQDPYREGKRVPINLMFSDGAALHMQAFPEIKCAYVFGGFVRLSEEFSKRIQEISKQNNQHPSISRLIPYEESNIKFLKLINHTNRQEILCKNPAWSASALFSMFNYYRVQEVKANDSIKLLMTFFLGVSSDNNEAMEFYENSDKSITVKLNDKYYKPIKGVITLEDLDNFIINYTGN
jgi:hypothetical protein